LDSGVKEHGDLPVDVAPRAVNSDDGFRTEVLLVVIDFLHDGFDSFVPTDPFPFVFAALTDPLHGVFEAVGMVDRFDQVQASHAQPALVEGIQGIAFDFFQFAVFGVQQETAGVMAAGRRVLMGTRYDVFALLPSPCAGMVSFFVDRIVYRHSFFTSLLA